MPEFPILGQTKSSHPAIVAIAKRRGAIGVGAHRGWFGPPGIRILVLLLAVGNAVPVALALGYFALENRRIARVDAYRDLQNNARLVAGDMRRAAENTEHILAALAETDAILDSGDVCDDVARRQFDRSRLFSNILVVDLAGRPICSVLRSGTQAPYADRDYFRRALARPGPQAGGLLAGNVTGAMLLPFAHRIVDAQGNPKGVIIIGLAMARALGESSTATHGERYALTILDTGGAVVARDPPAREALADATDTALFAALRGEQRRSGTLEATGLDGFHRIHAYELLQLQDQRFWVLASISSRDLYGRIDAAFVASLLVAAAITLGLAILGWGVGEILVRRPLARIADAAGNMRQGHYGLPSDAATGVVEVRMLAQALDRMGSTIAARENERARSERALREAHSDLERKVSDRTAELGAAVAEAGSKAERLETSRREAEVLRQIANMTQASHDMGEAWTIIEGLAPQIVGGTDGGIFALHEGNALLLSARWGDAKLPAKFSSDDCWALRLGESYQYDAVTTAPHCPHVHEATTRYACIPLNVQGEKLGIMHVSGNLAGTASESVGALANQVALAMANVKLRQTLHDLSVSDPLTGLFNRHLMEEMLRREVARAKRAASPLSILVFDFDRFSDLNAAFGHERCDDILRQFGALLRRSFRASDIACRKAGDRFVVIMPETDADVASERAAQIAAALHELLARDDAVLSDRVAVSIGLAAHPDSRPDCEDLMEAAEIALQKAKSAGRGGVVLAAPLAH